MSKRLIARVEPDPNVEQSFLVRSPAVGMADSAPAVGMFLNPQEGFLSLQIMGRRHILQLRLRTLPNHHRRRRQIRQGLQKCLRTFHFLQHPDFRFLQHHQSFLLE